MPYGHRDTPQRVKSQLLSTYHDRVDVLFKAVHWPMVVTSIKAMEHSGYDKHPNTATSVLKAAVYFTASYCKPLSFIWPASVHLKPINNNGHC
ncbi:hypothetical protein Slin15195_G028050 [Septoria linicola]|uniref:Uncharacterized protein n=1 Tax=Septoria linicola TaxID=215465 RepID=A0A9Q9EF69_9PEZI|nr:hypothetical protein Slin14017_G027100 [Septoria linicola]USW49486.1 hypothetical protein Slin15195_G028050 [Septoria linicola]